MVDSSTGVELDDSVGLEVDGLGVVARENAEGLVEGVRVTRKREGEVRQVVGVDLRLVRACRHDPVAIVTDAHTLAGLLEAKILQQLYAIRKFGVVLQAPTLH